MPRLSKGVPLEVRFRSRVVRGPWSKNCGSFCWDWLGLKNDDGYGSICVKGRSTKVHRFSFLRTGMEIPEGLSVLHRCDRPCCVNPSHLFLGSQLDNIQDMVEKGRQRGAVGEANRHAKLTEQDVKAIRRLYVRGSKEFGTYGLAKRFGICANNVQMIVTGQTWKGVK